MSNVAQAQSATTEPQGDRSRRTLVVACTAHALHDGYTDLIYVLLPVWRSEFGLDFAALALLRGVYAGAMAAFQIPAGRLAERFGGRLVLVLGTLIAAAGYALAGVSGGIIGLYASLALSGLGSGTQHPVGSAAVSRAFGTKARRALGFYNFAGDLGKAAIPAATSLLLALIAWRTSLLAMSVVGVLIAVAASFLPEGKRDLYAWVPPLVAGKAEGRGGFWLLIAIGVLDTSVRMGFLTFLPFLMQHKGAAQSTIGVALALVFLGGAAGKFTFGWLGERLGVLRATVLSEAATAACIAAVTVLPLVPMLIVLPLLGAMLNGTSSILYGTVPEVAPEGHTERAFALFYTGVIGAGAVSPVLYGVLGDTLGAITATIATALTALAILPLAFGLAVHLPPRVVS